MMGYVSLTAPRFTEEDERRELANQSLAEQEEIERDVFGHESGFVKDTDLMKAEGTAKLEEAIEMIPAAEKQNYLRALELCPDLVQSESEPVRFLRATSPAYKPWDAAKLLVKYWDLRREVFGEKAFLPIHSTGHGALSPEAIELLRAGIWVRLPNDSKGRAVVYFDRSKLHIITSHLRNAYTQSIFYIFSALLDESDYVQRKGVVFVANIQHETMKFDRRIAKATIKLMCCEYLPIRYKAIHLCLPHLKPPFLWVAPVLKHMCGKYLRRHAIFHYGGIELILLSLESYGLKRNLIPDHIQGGLNVELKHKRWLSIRRRIELAKEQGRS